jgi:hypothetical protein
MKFLLVFLFFSQVYAQDWQGSIITDPRITSRCDHLGQKREEKIQIKQRLTALLLRSERLIKGTPENKISVKSKLTTNRSRLQQEMALNKVLTSQVEEEIVRKGCPGINL